VSQEIKNNKQSNKRYILLVGGKMFLDLRLP